MIELLRFAAESGWNLFVTMSILFAFGCMVTVLALALSDFQPIRITNIKKKKEIKGERDSKS